MKCPACNASCQTMFVCAPCWARVPVKDRAWLWNRRDAEPKTLASKLEKVVLELKASQ